MKSAYFVEFFFYMVILALLICVVVMIWNPSLLVARIALTLIVVILAILGLDKLVSSGNKNNR